MKYPCFYFFRLAHIPEVFAEVAAGTAGYVHFTLVLVMADGALPFVIVVYYDFPVKAAYVAVIALRIEFGILYVVVNVFDDVLNSRKIMAHIRYFHVGYSPARRNLLELTFERKFRSEERRVGKECTGAC